MGRMSGRVGGAGGGGGAGGAGLVTAYGELATDLSIPTGGTFQTLATLTIAGTVLDINAHMSGAVLSAGSLRLRIQVDGVSVNCGSYAEMVNSGAGFSAHCAGRVSGLAPGNHTVTFSATFSGAASPYIHPILGDPLYEGARLFATQIAA